MNFKELYQKADSLKIRYWEVKPRVQLGNQSTFQFEQFKPGLTNHPIEVNLDPKIGLSAFREKVRKYFTRKELTAIEKGNKWESFKFWFNLQNGRKAKQSKKLILATAGDDNRAIGMMSNYRFVTHQTILDTIAEAHLDHLTDGWFTDHAMTVRIKLMTHTQGFAYLKIVNGFTGLKPLSYHFGVEIGSGEKAFNFSEPIQFAKKRHLKKVDGLLEIINDAVAVVRDMRLLDNLANVPYSTAYNIMINGQEKDLNRYQNLLIKSLNDEFGFGTKATALDLIVHLGNYRSIRNYATSVDKLCDPIVYYGLTLEN